MDHPSPFAAPHQAACKSASGPRVPPVHACPNTLPSLEARLSRPEDLVTNVSRLPRKEVMQRYGWAASTFHRRRRAGQLPEPIRLGGQLWRLVDLETAEKGGQLPRPASA